MGDSLGMQTPKEATGRVGSQYDWIMLALVGVLVAISCWSLLFGLLWLFRGREARVRARIKQFVTEETEKQGTEALQQRQLRENLFNNLDIRLSEQSLFKSMFQKVGDDISKADLRITVSEFVLIQLSVSAGVALVLFLLSPLTDLQLRVRFDRLPCRRNPVSVVSALHGQAQGVALRGPVARYAVHPGKLCARRLQPFPGPPTNRS